MLVAVLGSEVDGSIVVVLEPDELLEVEVPGSLVVGAASPVLVLVPVVGAGPVLLLDSTPVGL